MVMKHAKSIQQKISLIAAILSEGILKICSRDVQQMISMDINDTMESLRNGEGAFIHSNNCGKVNIRKIKRYSQLNVRKNDPI